MNRGNDDGSAYEIAANTSDKTLASLDASFNCGEQSVLYRFKHLTTRQIQVVDNSFDRMVYQVYYVYITRVSDKYMGRGYTIKEYHNPMVRMVIQDDEPAKGYKLHIKHK